MPHATSEQNNGTFSACSLYELVIFRIYNGKFLAAHRASRVAGRGYVAVFYQHITTRTCFLVFVLHIYIVL